MTKERFPAPRIWLDIPTCETIYKAFKDNALDYGLDAPKYDFKNRHDNVLESILGSVQLKAFLSDFDVVKVATSYFVKLARSQAFLDGNKRMSVILTTSFLKLNKCELRTRNNVLKDLALFVVTNKEEDDEEAIILVSEKFQEWIHKI